MAALSTNGRRDRDPTRPRVLLFAGLEDRKKHEQQPCPYDHQHADQPSPPPRRRPTQRQLAQIAPPGDQHHDTKRDRARDQAHQDVQ